MILGGSHVFSRIGIKEISDLIITILDPFQQAKFRSSPIIFKVGNPDQTINQHITTNNKISIEGRNVVDASGMANERQNALIQDPSEPKWTELQLTYIPNEDENHGDFRSIESQTKEDVINAKVADSLILNSGNLDAVQNISAIQQSANDNNLKAIHDLGTAFLRGDGVNKDVSQAFENFLNAASQGYAASQNMLGYCYESGNGVPQNPTRAAEWYIKSASQGFTLGLYNSGRCYLNGIGVPKDEVKAKECILEASSKGYAPANSILGVMYAQGLAVIKDLRTAAEYYLKAALEGDEHGQFRLAWAYEFGEGVPEDINLSIRWYSEVVKQESVLADDARYRLAKIHFTSSNHKNDELSAKYATESANNGHASSQTLLGTLYRFGKGVPQDLLLARQWYEKAVESGDQEASNELNDLNEIESDTQHVDCDCPAIDEALTYLDSFFETFDSFAYGESETQAKNYHRDYSVSYELESIINSVIEQNAGWDATEFHGILIENIDSLTFNNDDLILNFDGYANVIYKSGVATINISNNMLNFNGAFEWRDENHSDFCIWIAGAYIYLGNLTQNSYRWGGSWEIGDDRTPTLQETVNNANSWIARIFSIAKGDVDSQQVLYPIDEEVEDEELDSIQAEHIEGGGPTVLSDGSTWYGELDGNGRLTGNGTWLWPNGDRYDGTCENGFIHGEGTYNWANGEYYSGGWQMGKRHGFGININPDGTRREGDWADDLFQDGNQKKGLFSSFIEGFKSGYNNSSK